MQLIERHHGVDIEQICEVFLKSTRLRVLFKTTRLRDYGTTRLRVNELLLLLQSGSHADLLTQGAAHYVRSALGWELLPSSGRCCAECFW